MTQTRHTAITEARANIDKGSKSFALASRLFAPEVRERAHLLYAWCRACDDITDGQDYGQAAGAARYDGSPRALTTMALATDQPVPPPFEALRILNHEIALDPHDIEDHLLGFDLDRLGWAPQDETDLIGYCQHVAGVVGSMMARIMGVPADDRDTLMRARHLGVAFQLNNIARDVADDAMIGRTYLPQSWLKPLHINLKVPGAVERHRAEVAVLADRLVRMAQRFDASARIGAARLTLRSRIAVLAAANIYGDIGALVQRRGSRAWDTRAVTSKARKLALLALAVGQANMTPSQAVEPHGFDERLWRRRLDAVIRNCEV